MDSPLSPGEQKSPAFGILAHHVGVCVLRNPIGNLSPVSAAVARAINVRPQVVEPESIDRRVSRVLVEVAGVQNRDLHPWLELLRRNVGPGLATVNRAVNQTVIATGPNH